MSNKYNFDKRIEHGMFEIQVDTGAQYGYFEHTHYGDECGGGLWFENNTLVDYDGVYGLPPKVAEGLVMLGMVVPQDME